MKPIIVKPYSLIPARHECIENLIEWLVADILVLGLIGWLGWCALRMVSGQ